MPDTEKGLAAPTPAGGENALFTNEKKVTRADTKGSSATAVSQSLPFAPHTALSQKVLEALSSDADKGLSESEAAKRLEQYGPNRLKPPRRPSAWKILGRQFANAMCLVLSKSLQELADSSRCYGCFARYFRLYLGWCHCRSYPLERFCWWLH
jgi:Na+-exporting ATPase